MEDRMTYQDYEILGRYLDGTATIEDRTAVRWSLSAPLCELMLVSIKAMSFIKTGKR